MRTWLGEWWGEVEKMEREAKRGRMGEVSQGGRGAERRELLFVRAEG